MNRTDKGFYVTTISNLVPFMEFHQLNLQMNGLCQETRKKVDTILSIIKLSLVECTIPHYINKLKLHQSIQST